MIDCINTTSQLLACVCENGFENPLTLCRLELCEVISDVIRTSGPRNIENTLADTVANPMVAHIDGFGTFEFDCVGSDSDSG